MNEYETRDEIIKWISKKFKPSEYDDNIINDLSNTKKWFYRYFDNMNMIRENILKRHNNEAFYKNYSLLNYFYSDILQSYTFFTYNELKYSAIWISNEIYNCKKVLYFLNLCYGYPIYDDIILEIQSYCNSIEYKDFLRTQYWITLSKWKKELSGFKCQLCDKSKNLNTHHKTYIHKGLEVLYLDDLIVLCEACHSKYHDK